MAGASEFTSTIHRGPYPTISPTRPELSQKGNNVLVTGSSAGIGFAIARAFAQADAAIVVLTGRREAQLNDATKTLTQEFPKTKFIAKNLDISNSTQTEQLWDWLDSEGILVSVLVLNAARVQQQSASLIELDYKEAWPDFVTNVGANLDLSQRFYHQKKRASGNKLALVNISTMAAHDFNIVADKLNYSASKNSGTLLMQLLAKGIAPEDMQIISFHPGAIFTDAVKGAGYKVSDLQWDDENLPGQYAVWAASEEAKFLHGRFTWAAWDVDELQTGEIREHINNNPNYLQVGIIGL